MKGIVRCSQCSSASWRLGFGFAGSDELHCTERSGTVEPDDGCTFGARGQPGTAVCEYEIDIGNHAAVNGWHWRQ